MANHKTEQLVLMGLAAAFICITGPLVIMLPFSPVPLSLCTFTIYLFGYLLGCKQVMTSVLLYLLIGFFGLPVFAGFTSGPGKLLGPTGGYLLGYLLIALFCGLSKGKSRKSLLLFSLMGTVACYIPGTLWLAFQSGLNISAAFTAGVLPFLPGDLVKIVCAVFLAPSIQKRLHL
ncbi:MAG: biotin transporter BioY [Lachnospiraceae bacterium]|nr:biotin transporter BioY [Lachnospiraceae bacterium]